MTKLKNVIAFKNLKTFIIILIWACIMVKYFSIIGLHVYSVLYNTHLFMCSIDKLKYDRFHSRRRSFVSLL